MMRRRSRFRFSSFILLSRHCIEKGSEKIELLFRNSGYAAKKNTKGYKTTLAFFSLSRHFKVQERDASGDGNLPDRFLD